MNIGVLILSMEACASSGLIGGGGGGEVGRAVGRSPIAERLPSAMHDTRRVVELAKVLPKRGKRVVTQRRDIYTHTRREKREEKKRAAAHVQHTKRRSRAGPSLKDDRSLELDNFAEVATVCLRRNYSIG